MEEKEIWRDIQGYEGYYMVSNMGRVRSVERTIWNSGKGCYKTVHERILKPGKTNTGYLFVFLHKDGKAKFYTVHQLVGNAFLSNPQGYKELNHIDEDKTNNNADNLEWCSRSYNCSYNDRAKKAGKKLAEKLRNHPKKSKPVIAIHKINGLILEFPSAHEAERQTGINQGNITKCCKGKKESIGGFYWYYANVTDNDTTE